MSIGIREKPICFSNNPYSISPINIDVEIMINRASASIFIYMIVLSIGFNKGDLH